VYALLFGETGMTGMRMSFAFTFGAASGHTLYLEAAAGVTATVLAGKFLESRARARSSDDLGSLALLVLGHSLQHPPGARPVGDAAPGRRTAGTGVLGRRLYRTACMCC
jgi:P-type Cu+ transporter